MTSLTVVVGLILLVGFASRGGLGLALALAAMTPAGAAWVVGGVAVPTFYAVAVACAAGLGLLLLQNRVDLDRSGVVAERIPVPGTRSLVLLVGYSGLVTLLSPLAFDGLRGLRGGQSEFLVAGMITKSNAAQVIYLVLSVCLVVYLARSRRAGVQLLGLALGVVTALSFWAYAGTTWGVPFPAGLFDNSPGYAYIDSGATGEVRPRGIFSEPAGLAASCLATIAYSCARLQHVHGLRRLKTLVVLGTAAYLGWVSTSATFFIAGAAALVMVVLLLATSLLVRQRRLSHVAVTAVCAAAVAALWLLPALTEQLATVLDSKLASSSFDDRSGLDDNGVRLALSTFGLGTGLGANRASSFVVSTLSTIGVPGFVLFSVAVWSILRAAWPVAQARPAMWALLTFMVAKVITGPDLNDNSGVLWLSLGVLAHAGLRHREEQLLASGGLSLGHGGLDDAGEEPQHRLTAGERAAVLLRLPDMRQDHP